jgi:methionyl-tRNA synthetase
VPPGATVKKGEALFPRVDLKNLENKNGEDKPVEEIKAEKETEKGQAVSELNISIDDFARLDLRVAEIIACEKMEKADKLLI